MKKYFILPLMMLACTLTHAQDITIAEPTTCGYYFMLTSNAACDTLPDEAGMLEAHQNKTKNILSALGTAATLVSSAGTIGSIASTTINTAAKGARTAMIASNVSAVTSTAGLFAKSNGQDFKLKGKTSNYTLKYQGGDVQILVKAPKADVNALDIYRIARLTPSSKYRSVRWYQFDAKEIGSKAAKKKGFIFFTAQKYGQQSFILTIPASEIEAGEYGIFNLCIANENTVPVGTFKIE